MSRRLPPLNSLRAFEAAARHLSFKKADEELHVTPAAVTIRSGRWRSIAARRCSTVWPVR